jgi:glycosyltransferase involved in cell wall biosynthesis
MLVSLLTPTADRREFWPRCIQCFLSQDYPQMEWVIIDNGRGLIKDLLPDDPRIRYIPLPGKRLLHGQLMNIAMEHSSGEAAIVWDDDDFYAPSRVRKQMEPLRTGKYDIVGTSKLYYYQHGGRRAFEYRNLTPTRWLAAPAWRRSAWVNNRFDNLRQGADTNFLKRIPPERQCDLMDYGLLVSAIHPGNAAPKRIPSPSFLEVPWSKVEEMMKTVTERDPMNPRLLIAVASCHKDRGWQFAQRQTWMRDVPNQVACRFFLGNPAAQDALEDEVFLDVPDDYLSLPLKTKGIMRWSLDNGFSYTYKADIDTLVNVGNLVRSGYEQHDYMGGLNDLCSFPFASGGPGYCLSEKAMRLVIDASPGDEPAEDVFVAEVMDKGGIKLRNDPRFKFLPGSVLDKETVSYHLSSVHGWRHQYSPEQMFERYSEMKSL